MATERRVKALGERGFASFAQFRRNEKGERMKTLAIGFFALLTSSFCFQASAADAPDTHGNRLAAARRYLEAVQMKDMMRDMIVENAKNFPENVRDPYIQFITRAVRVDVIESIALASMAQHFTVKELNFLAACYGSPEDRSVMKKFGAAMADVMPAIQQEVLHAQQQLEGQSRQGP